MADRITIGLIGDYSDTIVAHRAIPRALALAGAQLGLAVEHAWVPSEEVTSGARVAHFDGLWCIPGSPYRSMQGALLGIQHARELQRPFLGTCGGFQHAVIEYARNVLHWADADHAESAPGAARVVIAPLSCGLLSSFGTLRLIAGTRLARAYGSHETEEEYLCSYGVNPALRASLISASLRAAALDSAGDLRGVELDGHRFFVATLFQPERAALHGKTPPLVVAFLNACRQ